jgi:S1-C subfamily serine protease
LAIQESVITHRPGDNVAVSYIRDGENKEVTVTLKNQDGDTGLVKKDETSVTSMLGATFSTITKDDTRKLGVEYGLKISKLDAGLFKSAGIKEGFIILSVDKKPIKSKEDLIIALKDKRGGVLIEGIYPNGMRAYYGFGM